MNIVSACQNLDHISHKSNTLFASLIKGFLFVFSEEVTHVGNDFLPQLFQFFHSLPFGEEALKAQFGSDSLSLCHKVIRLVSEQICPGAIQCKMLRRLWQKMGNSWLHSQ